MVKVECTGRFPVSLKRPESEKLVRTALKMGGFDGKSGTVNLTLVDDREIRRLNRRHMGKNRPTDVLSFGFKPGQAPLAGREQSPQLGDIVVSTESVRRQAKGHHRTIREEMGLMLVHGSLHLLGFDHDTAAKEGKMFGLQQDILVKAGIF